MLLRALERRRIAAEIVPGMPRATLSASIAMPLFPLPPGSSHQNWDDLVQIMARLRRSCPWDREQTHAVARALPGRRDLRSRRRDRGRQRRGPLRGARRLALSGRVPRAARDRTRQVFGRRRGRRALEQDDPPPSARLRRRRGGERRRSVAELGSAQGARSLERGAHVEARRDSERHAGTAARTEDAREGRARRLRLGRRARDHRKTRRRTARVRRRARASGQTRRTKIRTCAKNSATCSSPSSTWRAS